MLLTLALTLLAPLPAPTDQPAIIDERLEDEAAFEALHEAYAEAYDAWRDKLRAAEGSKERRELRKLEPTVLFRPRFEALANGGSGRALVWLVKKASKLEKRKQIPALKEEWDGRLFKDMVAAIKNARGSYKVSPEGIVSMHVVIFTYLHVRKIIPNL